MLTAGKVSQFATNLWHFFLTCLTKKINFIYANRRESEPICNESVALYPMIHTLRGATGDLHRDTT